MVCPTQLFGKIVKQFRCEARMTLKEGLRQKSFKLTFLLRAVNDGQRGMMQISKPISRKRLKFTCLIKFWF